jgi:multidrug efflux pump subunit AcrA (membrane-fusion protein)
MFANVDVLVLEKNDVLLVPDSALVYDRNGTYLWRVDDEGRAEKVPVEIGIRRFGRVEVLRGASQGDSIVTAGVNKVTAGVRLASNAEAPRRADAETGEALD